MRSLTAVSDGGRRGRGDGDERLARVIGRTRARVLAAVGEPQTTEHVAQLIGARCRAQWRARRCRSPLRSRPGATAAARRRVPAASAARFAGGTSRAGGGVVAVPGRGLAVRRAGRLAATGRTGGGWTGRAVERREDARNRIDHVHGAASRYAFLKLARPDRADRLVTPPIMILFLRQLQLAKLLGHDRTSKLRGRS
jgi:hypothetical protein